jgi:hypothetical protein
MQVRPSSLIFVGFQLIFIWILIFIGIQNDLDKLANGSEKGHAKKKEEAISSPAKAISPAKATKRATTSKKDTPKAPKQPKPAVSRIVLVKVARI